MSGEIKTTTTTAAGVMERLQADLTAGAIAKSRLFEAVWKEEAENANVVQFYSIPLPAERAAATEADDWTTNAVTLTAKTATLTAYPSATKVSKLALNGGQYVAPAIVEALTGDVALTIDGIICDQISDFGPFVDDTSCTAAVFAEALSALRNSGYPYDNPRAILTERQALDLGVSLGAMYNPRKNDEFSGTGFLGNVMGVDVFTVPNTLVPTSGSYGVGCIFYPNVGLGLGFNPNAEGGLIHAEMIEDLGAYKIAAAAYAAATELTSSGGVEIRTLNY